jgi:hypothetical protein
MINLMSNERQQVHISYLASSLFNCSNNSLLICNENIHHRAHNSNTDPYPAQFQMSKTKYHFHTYEIKVSQAAGGGDGLWIR